jgi:hypothetical protein
MNERQKEILLLPFFIAFIQAKLLTRDAAVSE